MANWSPQVGRVQRLRLQVWHVHFTTDVWTRLTCSTIVVPEESGSLGGFKPSRRVRDAPGGKSHILFGDDVEEETAAPSRKAAVRPHLNTLFIVMV